MAGIEMKGRTFGRLKVLERHHSTPKKVFWTCQCKCGKITVVDGWSLRSGETQSCGCLQRERAVEVGRKDMTGQTVNGIKVLEVDHKDNRNQLYWKCVCPYCGNIFVTRGSAIRNGHAKSCGCYNKISNITHNMSYSRLYHIHQGMIKRCYEPKSDSYPNYGGRGITICDEWLNIGMTPQEIQKSGNPGFQHFMKWALNSGYADNKTIDRRDVNGPYAPWNCRWLTNAEQQLNKRNNRHINDGEETLVWSEFCKKYHLDPTYVGNKIYKGWSLDAIVYAAKHPEMKIHIPRGSQQHKYPRHGVYLDKDEFQVLIPRIPNQVND